MDFEFAAIGGVLGFGLVGLPFFLFGFLLSKRKFGQDLRKSAANYQKQIQDESAKYFKAIASLEQAAKSHEFLLQDRKQKIAHLETSLTEAKKGLHTTSSENIDLQEKLKACSAEVEQTHRQIAELNNQLERMK